jgi:DNA anti-recombination protein RmuC
VPSAVISKTCGVTNVLKWGNSSSKAKNCQNVVKKLAKSCQKAVKKLSKSCKKLSESFQKVVKKLQKVVKKLQKIVKKFKIQPTVVGGFADRPKAKNQGHPSKYY